MATTALLVELLITGTVTALWILLLIIRTSIVSWAQLSELLNDSVQVAFLSSAVAGAVAYQLGVIVNGAGWALEGALFGSIRRRMFGQLGYDRTVAHALASGSGEALRRIDAHVMFIRLFRSAVINCVCAGVVIACFGGGWIFIGVCLSLLGFGCILLWRKTIVAHFEEMAAFAAILPSNHAA